MTVKMNTNCVLLEDPDGYEMILLVKELSVVHVRHIPGHGECVSVGTWTSLGGLNCEMENIDEAAKQVIAKEAGRLYYGLTHADQSRRGKRR